MPETHIYFGHHKCASTWIRSIIQQIHPGQFLSVSSDEEHCDYGRNLGTYIRKNRPAVIGVANSCYQHLGNMPEYKAFHVIRDPRDLVVSAYHSHRDLPRADKKQQNYLRHSSVEDGISRTIKDCRWEFWNMLNWNYHDPNIMELKFEDLIASPVDVFDSIFSYWDFNLNGRISEVIEANSFEQLTGRIPGDERKGDAMRKGIAGDWRNYFTREHKQEFHDMYGNILIDLGYEKDDRWI